MKRMDDGKGSTTSSSKGNPPKGPENREVGKKDIRTGEASLRGKPQHKLRSEKKKEPKGLLG